MQTKCVQAISSISQSIKKNTPSGDGTFFLLSKLFGVGGEEVTGAVHLAENSGLGSTEKIGS